MLYTDLVPGLDVIYVHTGRPMTVVACHDNEQMVTCRYEDARHQSVEVKMPPAFLQALPIDSVLPPRDVVEWRDGERDRQRDAEENNS